MYHCNLQLVLVGFSNEIFEYLKSSAGELLGEKISVDVTRVSCLNGKIISDADVIFAEVDSGIEDILLMYSVSKKKDSRLILSLSNSQLQKTLKSENRGCITDIWDYGITSEVFAFRFEKLTRDILAGLDKWLAESYLENVIDSTDDLIWFKDKMGVHLKVNESFCNAVNKTKEQIAGRGHYYIWDISPEEYIKGEFVCMESEYEVMAKKEKCWFDEDVLIKGEMRKLRTCKSPLFDCDGSVMGTVGVAKDVTRELEYKARLEAELKSAKVVSKIDKLTGLGNRFAYDEDINNFDTAFRRKDFVYVSFDLNGLKTVNDNVGHLAGDELIKTAAMCIKNCFGPYGKTYRIGGDEFAAMINADQYDLARILRDFENMTFNWTGDYVESISVSYGYVEVEDDSDRAIIDIAKEADVKMFDSKLSYYERKGIDRRSKEELLEVLKCSYLKILKINLSSDACVIARVSENELNAAMGFDETLSQWIRNFIKAGKIHQDDLEEFEEKMNLVYLREYFKNHSYFSMKYKRMVDGEYKNVFMEMVTADEYSDDNQIVFLYVKKID